MLHTPLRCRARRLIGSLSVAVALMPVSAFAGVQEYFNDDRDE